MHTSRSARKLAVSALPVKSAIRAGALVRPTVRFAPGTTVDAQGFLPTIPNE